MEMGENSQDTERPRIAWFAPGEGRYSRTASGYLTKTLLPYLADSFDVDVFNASPTPVSGACGSFHYLTAASRHIAHPYDLFFYNMEDVVALGFSRIHLGCLPGVVYFHDLLLSTDGPEPILNSPWRHTLARFWNRAAPWPARTAEHAQPRPHAYREGGYALIPVFANGKDHAEFQRVVAPAVPDRLGRDLPSFCLPYPADSNERPHPAAGALRRVGFSGRPRIESRAHKLFEALTALPDHQLVWLVDPTDKPAAEELVREFELGARTELVSPRSPEKLAEIAPSLAVSVHTLFSVYGQPGPYLSVSLAAGLPCIVTDFGSTPELPDSIVAKVEPGRSEAYQIRAILRELAAHESVELRQRIQDFARDQLASQKIAAELGAMFRASIPLLRPILSDWQAFERDASSAVVAEAQGVSGPQERWLDAWKQLLAPTLGSFVDGQFGDSLLGGSHSAPTTCRG